MVNVLSGLLIIVLFYHIKTTNNMIYLLYLVRLFRGRYRISRKGGAWVDAGNGYFMVGRFVAGHITRCTDKMSADKILGDKTPVKIARGGQNASHFKGQGGQNANLI